MLQKLVAFCLLLLLAAAAAKSQLKQKAGVRLFGSVVWHPLSNTYSFSNSAQPAQGGRGGEVIAARAVFDDTLLTTGWGELTLVTSPRVPDYVQAYAAGYVEGALTHNRIYDLFSAIKDEHAKKPEVGIYQKRQLRHIRNQVRSLDTAIGYDKRKHAFDTAKAFVQSGGFTPSEKVYWYNVKLVMAQLDGLLHGYNDHSPHKLNIADVWLINNDGDILDIERAAAPGRVFRFSTRPSHQELLELLAWNSRCSALIKYTGDDILVAHSTWADYDELNRIYKHYHFSFGQQAASSSPRFAQHRARRAQTQLAGTRSQRSSFSSYPGMIFSSDDFYILDSGLVLIETTINVLDESLYRKADPENSVFAWIRNLVANRLARDGAEWTEIFGLYNSGTYNNQWMVVDMNKFTPGQPLKPGTLFLAEQVPGLVKRADITNILQKSGYWASYNRPFFREINEVSMFAKYASSGRDAELFSYRTCPRAKIFARDQSKVRNLSDMKHLMRSNNYQHDPLSGGCPGNAIAARHDLDPVRGANCGISKKPNGATDCKVTNYQLSRVLAAEIINGPTNQGVPAFAWQGYRKYRPAGVPDIFNFPWKTTRPDPAFVNF